MSQYLSICCDSFVTLYMFPRSDVTNYHRLGGLKQQIFFSLTVLKAIKAKVKVQARWVPSEDSEEESIPFLVTPGVPCFLDFPCRHIISISDSILILWWFNC